MHDRRPLVRSVEDIARIKSSVATDNAEVASARSTTTTAMVGGEKKTLEGNWGDGQAGHCSSLTISIVERGAAVAQLDSSGSVSSSSSSGGGNRGRVWFCNALLHTSKAISAFRSLYDIYGVIAHYPYYVNQ